MPFGLQFVYIIQIHSRSGKTWLLLFLFFVGGVLYPKRTQANLYKPIINEREVKAGAENFVPVTQRTQIQSRIPCQTFRRIKTAVLQHRTGQGSNLPGNKSYTCRYLRFKCNRH